MSIQGSINQTIGDVAKIAMLGKSIAELSRYNKHMAKVDESVKEGKRFAAAVKSPEVVKAKNDANKELSAYLKEKHNKAIESVANAKEEKRNGKQIINDIYYSKGVTNE